jgi:hypothetical protein
MAILMARGDVCAGSNTKPDGLRTIDKRRRNDTPPKSMIVGWCKPCQSWIAINDGTGFLRPHKKRKM